MLTGGIIWVIVAICIIISAVKILSNNTKNNNNSNQSQHEKGVKRIEEEDQKRKIVIDYNQHKDKPDFKLSDKPEALTAKHKDLDVKSSSSQNHDYTCREDNCDGCGSDDVYAQVYGKRKKNKIKK